MANDIQFTTFQTVNTSPNEKTYWNDNTAYDMEWIDFEKPWWKNAQKNDMIYMPQNTQQQIQQIQEQINQPQQEQDRLSNLEQLKSKQNISYSPNQNLDYAYKKLLSKGYSKHAAAGIIGNLFVESGGKINAIGDKGTSYGLAQWHDTSSGKGRMTRLFSFAGTRNPSLDQQIDFLDKEVKENQKLYTKLNSSNSASEAAETFCRIFERPSQDAIRQSLNKRKNYANYILKKNVG